jgi:hypothetical protein
VLSEDAEREYVENPLLANPRAGVLLAAPIGFRKLRVPMVGRGKSGGGRVVYYCVGALGRIYLVAFFAKNEKENLTKAERNALKQIASWRQKREEEVKVFRRGSLAWSPRGRGNCPWGAEARSCDPPCAVDRSGPRAPTTAIHGRPDSKIEENSQHVPAGFCAELERQ